MTWVPTLQAAELCRGCSFLWFVTLLFDKALGTLKAEKKQGSVFWKCKGVALPSAAVHSNAHCKDQRKHHESYNDDQPVCGDRGGRGGQHGNVYHVALPFHRTARTQSLLLPFSCHTLFLASMSVCLVYKISLCKSNAFSSFSHTQASSD